MPVKPEDELLGRTFEKCRITGKLGAGGMSSVYLAEHAGLGRKVAIKILPKDLGDDPENVARFKREAMTAGRMEHPNIVQVHDVGHAFDRHFIVMQYVDGESLSTIVETFGKTEPRDAARIGLGILHGLQHAHEQGVVHRDVKPDNVLLAKGDEPKLLDFGLAIERDSTLNITRHGMVVGTPYYLSPEQARGHKATPASDIYAVGVTLYYILTGKRPFTGETALAVLNKHIHETPVPPRRHAPSISLELNTIVLRMMAKRPEDRYPSAAEAGEDLERFLKGIPVKARPPWRFSTLSRSASLAAAGVILVGAILWVAWPSDDPLPAPPPPFQARIPVASPQLQKIVESQNQSHGDFAAYRKILENYDTFIKTSAVPEFTGRAKDLREEFLASIEQQARDLYERLPRSGDPVERLRALDAFPAALLDLVKDSEIGGVLRRERNHLAERAERWYVRGEEDLADGLANRDFERSRRLVDDLLRYAEGDRRAALLRTRDEDLPALEGRHGEEVTRRLSESFATPHETAVRALGARDPAAAFAALTGFVKGHEDSKEKERLRIPGLDYDRILDLVPDGVLPEPDLERAREALERAAAGGTDDLRFRVLADLLDAIDLAWLFRRAAAGLQELSAGGREVELVTFGSTGRITFGQRGYALTPARGGPKAVAIRELHPGDLFTLAAAAERLSPGEAFDRRPRLVRAAAVAWLHSSLPGRGANADRWLRKAGGPAFRLDEVRRAGRREARAAMEAAAGPDVLEKLREQWSHDAAFASEISRELADRLVADLGKADGAGDLDRAKGLARRLRQGHVGEYDPEEVNPLYARALRSTGSWTFLPAEPEGGTWTWKGNTPPVRVEATHEGFRMTPGGRLSLAPDRARGLTGLSAEVRLNDGPRSPSAGLRIAGPPELLFRVEDLARVSLYEVREDGEDLLHSAPLEKGPPDRWIELSFVAEEGDVACYVDRKPVFIVRAGGSNGGAALESAGDANFRKISLRR